LVGWWPGRGGGPEFVGAVWLFARVEFLRTFVVFLREKT
jgi:hypothetical protein